MTTERHRVGVCELCGLPAVCIDADLADPWYWCGLCCTVHDGNAGAAAHLAAEGIDRNPTRPDGRPV